MIILIWVFALLFSGCADRDFLDKNQIVSSIIRGEKVHTGSILSKRIVLITRQLVLTGKTPTFFGICTGAVITDRVILTAAHCLEEDTSQMRIIANPDPRLQFHPAQDVYKVQDTLAHSQYVPLNKDSLNSMSELKNNSDLALIYLTRPLQGMIETEPEFFTKKKTEFDVSEPYSHLIITGFGRTTALKNLTNYPTEKINGILKQASLAISNYEAISRPYIVLSQKTQPGVCHGDSGGPVFFRHRGRHLLHAMAINVFRLKSEKSSAGLGNYNECSGYGLYLNLKNYSHWISNSVDELKLRNLD